MSKQCWRALLALLSLWLLAATGQADETVQRLLRQADAYRQDGEASRIETLVEQFRDGQPDKSRRYTVYTQSGRRSLVLMKSPGEIGQKVLMLDDQFWIIMPDSQRPMRITASQKLLGEASTGDIATLTWSEDYEGKLSGEEELDHRRCLRLELESRRKGSTYTRIVLYLEASTALPVKADLYVHSGRRAKEAWYEAGTLGGKTRIVGMTLRDDIQTSRHTIIRYQSIAPHRAPDEFFNPAALIRNPLSGW